MWRTCVPDDWFVRHSIITETINALIGAVILFGGLWLKYLPTVFYKGLRASIPAIAVGSSASEPMMRSGFSVAIGTSL